MACELRAVGLTSERRVERRTSSVAAPLSALHLQALSKAHETRHGQSQEKLNQLGAVLAGAIALAHPNPAAAGEPFPIRPIRIVVPVSAGGWGDAMTRLVAQHMSKKLGQPVVVENRTGGGGQIGIRSVKTATADGYTLVSTGGTLAIQAAWSRKPGYDSIKDLVAMHHEASNSALEASASTSADHACPGLGRGLHALVLASRQAHAQRVAKILSLCADWQAACFKH